MSARSESETRCPMCEHVIREDDLYEDGCPFCGTWIEVVPVGSASTETNE